MKKNFERYDKANNDRGEMIARTTFRRRQKHNLQQPRQLNGACVWRQRNVPQQNINWAERRRECNDLAYAVVRTMKPALACSPAPESRLLIARTSASTARPFTSRDFTVTSPDGGKRRNHCALTGSRFGTSVGCCQQQQHAAIHLYLFTIYKQQIARPGFFRHCTIKINSCVCVQLIPTFDRVAHLQLVICVETQNWSLITYVCFCYVFG